MKGFKEDGLMPRLTIYTDSVSAIHFLSWQMQVKMEG